MHPEQNEREATIDTENEKTICEREKEKIKKTNERTKASNSTSCLRISHFRQIKKTNSSGYRLVVATQNCLYLQ